MRSAQFSLVKRAKPRVVVAGHDRKVAALAPELGEAPQAGAFAGAWSGCCARPSRNRRDRRRSRVSHRGRSCDEPVAEAPVAIGSIESQVDVAGEIMRHDQRISAATSSWSRSQRRRPAGGGRAALLCWLFSTRGSRRCSRR